jgi:hypothetical protein
MINYRGEGPLSNCTPDQNASINVLLNIAPAHAHDGLRREIAKALDGPGPFTDSEVMAATQQMLVDHSGVPIPKALFAGATPVADTKRRVPR